MSSHEPGTPRPDKPDADAPRPQAEGFWDGETREMSRARERTIGPYLVLLKVGEGGMGIVYKALDEKLNRAVAIKVLKDRLTVQDRYLQRLEREARAVASVSHPAVIQVFAFEDGAGSEPGGANGGAGEAYIVMEYVDGESIEARLGRGEVFSVQSAIELVAQAARGLQAAHEKTIIHRDIKPSNLLLTSEGEIKIVDFGLSKAIDCDASITDDGVVLGTPHYISPEQGQGHKVDHRSDIYSLGATFYHMITGRPVFEGDSHASIIYSHVHDHPTPPEDLRGDIPPQVSQVIGKMLAKDPEHRYASYHELLADLEKLGRGAPIGRETAIAGRRAYRTPWWRSRAAFWFVAGLATWTTLAICVLGVLAYLDPGERSPLAEYERSTTAGTPFLVFDFARMGAAPDGLERLEEHFHVEPRPVLHRDGLVSPQANLLLVFRHELRRLDTLLLQELELEGNLHLGVYLLDRSGKVRQLRFALVGADEHAVRASRPIDAKLHTETVLPEPEPPLLPALDGVVDVSLRFRRGTGTTEIAMEVRRSGAGSGESGAPIYSGEQVWVLDGEDWNTGRLELHTETPRGAPVGMSFRLRALQIVGDVDRQPFVVEKEVRA